MRQAYPVIISKVEDVAPYSVYVPDFDAYTQGESVADAIVMARDLIGSTALALRDDLGQPVPEPSSHPFASRDDDIVTLVDIDLGQYRRELDMTPVKKTLLIPSYLNQLGVKAGLNFSATLTKALEERLVGA